MRGEEWTPDFTAGSGRLVVEGSLHDYVLLQRGLATVAASADAVAHPELVRRPEAAIASVALESAAHVLLWRRTRTWRDLRQPRVVVPDVVLGLVSGVLAQRSMNPAGGETLDSWAEWLLRIRVATLSAADRRGSTLAAKLALEVLPFVAPRSLRGAAASTTIDVGALALTAAGGSYFGRIARRCATAADARTKRWAEDDLAARLSAEHARFTDEILAPLPRVLRRLADSARLGRLPAVETAAAEEALLRAWIDEPSALGAHRAVVRDARLDEIEAIYRSGRLRVEGALRVASATTWWCSAGRTGSPPGRSRRAVGVAATVHGAYGLASFALPAVQRVDERSHRRLGLATDLPLLVAATAHEAHADAAGRRVLGQICHTLVAVPNGSTRERGRGIDTVALAMAALRAVAVGRRRRTATTAVAEVVARPLFSLATAWLAHRTWSSTIERLRTDAGAALDAIEAHPELVAIRAEQRAFVHDGVVQLLGALGAPDLVDPCEIVPWIERERVRIEARLGYRDEGHAGDLTSELAALTVEFERRGLDLVSEATELPGWVDDVAGTVIEIVRESLNNIDKHSSHRAAWCGITRRDDGTVVVRVADLSGDARPFRPGSGVGTATMIALAGMIGARIDWLRSPGGTVEVRLELTEPSMGRSPSPSGGFTPPRRGIPGGGRR